MTNIYSHITNGSDFLKISNNINDEAYNVIMDNSPQSPTFTIAIPTYKRIETLKEAIDSALNQSYKIQIGGGQNRFRKNANVDSTNNADSSDFVESSDKSPRKAPQDYEIIVVENCDDASVVSQTQEFLTQNYSGKITYYKNQRNLGLFGNWNQCLKLARGKWVCILHDDDILLPNYLEKMAWAIENIEPNTSLISHRTIFFGNLDLFGITEERKDTFKYWLKTNVMPLFKLAKNIKKYYYKCEFKLLGIQTYKYLDKRSSDFIAKFNTLHPSCMLHNKDICLKLGGYNPLYFPSDDWYFHTRAALHSNVYQINETLSKYRLAINASFKKDTMLGFGILDYYHIKDNMKVSKRIRKILLQKHYERILDFKDSDVIKAILEAIKLQPITLSQLDKKAFRLYRKQMLADCFSY